MDEIWSFVKNKKKEILDMAICRFTKLVIGFCYQELEVKKIGKKTL